MRPAYSACAIPILSLLFLLLLLPLKPSFALNATTLAMELSLLPEEDCMSIPQLGEILPVAALNTSNGDIHHSTVIITSCDLPVSSSNHSQTGGQ